MDPHKKLFLLPHSLNPNHVGSLEQWEHLVWGSPVQGFYGRISAAIRVFLERQRGGSLTYVYLGNGTFVAPDGRSEAEFTRDFAITQMAHMDGVSQAEIEAFRKRCILETVSGQVTRDEVAGCARRCLEMGVEQILIFTTPFHAPRSLRDMLAWQEKNGTSLRIGAEVALTEPPHARASRVEIKEPPLLG